MIFQLCSVKTCKKTFDASKIELKSLHISNTKYIICEIITMYDTQIMDQTYVTEFVMDQNCSG